MGRVLIISAIMHAVFLLLAPLIPQLLRDRPIAMDVYAVELVDLTATARPTPEPAAQTPTPEPDPAPAQEAPKPKVEEPPRDRVPEEPVKPPPRQVVKPPPRPEKSLAERLADRLRAEDERREESPGSEREAPRTGTPSAVAGPARTSVSVSRFPYAWYISIIQGKVSSNWKRPSDRLVSQDELTVQISFRISRDGSVGAVTVRRSSGSTTVDQSAAKAVRSSAPFPPLPDDYRDDRLDVTIPFTVERE